MKGRKVHILIDSGSTHSFIDNTLVKELKLVAQVVPRLLVTVADGTSTTIDTMCKGLSYNFRAIVLRQT